MMKRKALFYCQSLLGTGHFIRSREIVRSMQEFDTCFVYGGEHGPGFHMPAGVRIVSLPAVKSDESFQHLYTVDAGRNLADVMRERKERLLAVFDQYQPDLLIVELFPFGRKKFSDELLSLLAYARASRPEMKIVCSLRDILVRKPNQAAHEAEVRERLRRYFDMVMIHSDPEWQRLEETFASVSEIACPIEYTGYVVREIPRSAPAPRDPAPLILVSIGGGRVGHELIGSAVAATEYLQSDFHMHIVGGPLFPPEAMHRLQQQTAACDRISVEGYTTKFPAWLAEARLSISLAGYNTCLEILASGTQALLYPFRESGNDEQERRARKFAEAGMVRFLNPEDLAPVRLAEQIDRHLTLPPEPPRRTIDMKGAKRTADLLRALF
jgi:predicted glycosyltransferase